MDLAVSSSAAAVIIPTYTLEPYMPLNTSGMVALQMLHDDSSLLDVDPRPTILEWIDNNVIDATEVAV
jgi:hypothetical protein